MKRLRGIALALSLLIHGAGAALFYQGMIKADKHAALAVPRTATGVLRLWDPAQLPPDEADTPPRLPRPVRIDTGAAPPGDPADLSRAEAGTAGESPEGIDPQIPGDTLPPGGDYPGPLYPERARKEGREGRVTVLIRVDATGRINTISVEENAGGSDFVRSVLKASETWRFPAGAEGLYRRTFLFRLGYDSSGGSSDTSRRG